MRIACSGFCCCDCYFDRHFVTLSPCGRVTGLHGKHIYIYDCIGICGIGEGETPLRA